MQYMQYIQYMQYMQCVADRSEGGEKAGCLGWAGLCWAVLGGKQQSLCCS